jgi:hypothetical protein
VQETQQDQDMDDNRDHQEGRQELKFKVIDTLGE